MTFEIATSIRMPVDLRDLDETPTKRPNRQRTGACARFCGARGERGGNEIAMIMEGRDPAHAGKLPRPSGA